MYCIISSIISKKHLLVIIICTTFWSNTMMRINYLSDRNIIQIVIKSKWFLLIIKELMQKNVINLWLPNRLFSLKLFHYTWNNERIFFFPENNFLLRKLFCLFTLVIGRDLFLLIVTKVSYNVISSMEN